MTDQNKTPVKSSAPALSVVAGSPLWLIAAERIRQQNEEGWTPEHDDEHTHEQLAEAAACYATPQAHRRYMREQIVVETARGLADPDAPRTVTVLIPAGWPWDARWWKPKPDDRKREIIKACALLLAEYERLSRAEAVANTKISHARERESQS